MLSNIIITIFPCKRFFSWDWSRIRRELWWWPAVDSHAHFLSDICVCNTADLLQLLLPKRLQSAERFHSLLARHSCLCPHPFWNPVALSWLGQLFLRWLRCVALMSCFDASLSGYQPFHHLNSLEIEVLHTAKQLTQYGICGWLKKQPPGALMRCHSNVCLFLLSLSPSAFNQCPSVERPTASKVTHHKRDRWQAEACTQQSNWEDKGSWAYTTFKWKTMYYNYPVASVQLLQLIAQIYSAVRTWRSSIWLFFAIECTNQ